ncbi:MAG: ligase-associated DNA damage response exonuclease [SAR86 cluster bacterium]|nr:ligase-associated DNA damage response exonuclease [SAR86 cluster bacterium]|tara:strand:- start:537 stop:1526 length:990 start_codon:yes stop_codon:yes gene_type:complete
MIEQRIEGLYCIPGDFYIDPYRKCKNAFITHGHADHARPGMENYFCTPETAEIMKHRISQHLSIKKIKYFEKIEFNGVTVIFYPAGHVLGSAQILIEYKNKRVVVTGDYKRQHDSTCLPFHPVECDTFITEATFANPKFQWGPFDVEIGKIYKWYLANKKKRINSVLFGYSLGKSQRLINALKKRYKIEVFAHNAIRSINKIYSKFGVGHLETKTISSKQGYKDGIVVMPPGARKSKLLAELAPYRTAFCSGWITGKHAEYDEGFQISDHADWNDLIKTIEQTKTREVILIHGSGPMLRKYLNSKNIVVSNYTKSHKEDKSVQLSMFNE